MNISPDQKTQKNVGYLIPVTIKIMYILKRNLLSTIESSSIRSTVTKLRLDRGLDINCKRDCKNRSFRYKHVQSDNSNQSDYVMRYKV